MASGPPPPPRRVLLIGWDAADWKVALPLIAEGKMPALKRLMDQGVWGDLATVRPILSPMLWTSIATGKRAWKHGILGFTEPCPRTGGIRPITNLSRKTKAIWNIFHQQGWRSHVIGWWPSHPAEPIRGVMVSNHYQQARKVSRSDWQMQPGTVFPPELAEPLREFRVHPSELENEHVLPFIPGAAEIERTKGKRLSTCARIIAEISSIHGAATACMQMEPWDFMAVYYDGIDHFGHGFMKFHPPRLPWVDEAEFGMFRHVIESAYRYHDMMLDALLKMAGEETTVMLISDHGFEPGNLRPKQLPNAPAGPAAEHSPYGIFVLRGPGIRQGERIHGASLLDIAPTLLHLYGLPVGSDMDGRVLVNCFESPQSPQSIPSWDLVDGECGRHSAESVQNSVEAGEGLRQLIDLGYIDEPDPDEGQALEDCIREQKFNLAEAYADGGETGTAAHIFEQLWERWPEESRFGVKFIECQLRMRDAAGSRRSFECLKRRKAEAALLAERELSRLEAESAAREAGELPPLSEEARKQFLRQRSKLQRRAGSNPQALAFLEAAILLLEGSPAQALATLPDPDAVSEDRIPALLSKRAEILLLQRHLEQAEGLYRSVLALNPRDANAHFGIAQCHFHRKHYYEAAAEVVESLELQFNQPTVHFLYARILLRLGNAKLAAQTLVTAIGIAPNFSLAHRLLGRIYRHWLKDPDKSAFHAAQADSLRNLLLSRRQKGTPQVETNSVNGGRFPSVQARTKCKCIAPDSNPLIVVSGLPRSGTSMMMQLLQAGGISLVTDALRCADASNPKGYYEHERIKRLPYLRKGPQYDALCDWLQTLRGQAIKIVAPLLPLLPEDLPLQIIFMERYPEEVRKSQQQMLQRLGKAPSIFDSGTLDDTLSRSIKAVSGWIEGRSNVDVLPVSHAQLMTRPAEVVAALSAFLERPFDPESMIRIIDPALHRVQLGGHSG